MPWSTWSHALPGNPSKLVMLAWHCGVLGPLGWAPPAAGLGPIDERLLHLSPGWRSVDGPGGGDSGGDSRRGKGESGPGGSDTPVGRRQRQLRHRSLLAAAGRGGGSAEQALSWGQRRAFRGAANETRHFLCLMPLTCVACEQFNLI